MARPEAVGWRSLVPIHDWRLRNQKPKGARCDNMSGERRRSVVEAETSMVVDHDEGRSGLGTDGRAVRQTGRERDWSVEPRGTVCSELQDRLLPPRRSRGGVCVCVCSAHLPAAVVTEDEVGEVRARNKCWGETEGGLGVGWQDGGRPCLWNLAVLERELIDSVFHTSTWVHSIAAPRRQIFLAPSRLVSSRRRSAKGKFHGGYHTSPPHQLARLFLQGTGCVNLNGGAVPATSC